MAWDDLSRSLAVSAVVSVEKDIVVGGVKKVKELKRLKWSYDEVLMWSGALGSFFYETKMFGNVF
jgi:hypothetical protein